MLAGFAVASPAPRDHLVRLLLLNTLLEKLLHLLPLPPKRPREKGNQSPGGRLSKRVSQGGRFPGRDWRSHQRGLIRKPRVSMGLGGER